MPPAETVTPIATADKKAPRISRLSMTRRRFRVGLAGAAAARRVPQASARKRRRTPRGTAFRFRLSENATVRIAIEAPAPGAACGAVAALRRASCATAGAAPATCASAR